MSEARSKAAGEGARPTWSGHVAVHRRHGQWRFMVANEEGDQLCRLFVAGIGRYLMDAVWRLVKAFPRLEYGLGAALHLEANRTLGHISDHGAGMAVRFVCLARRVVYFDDGGAQMAAIQLRQGVREIGGMARPGAGLRGRKACA